MASELENVRDHIVRVEKQLTELKTEMKDVENGCGIWSEASPETRVSYITTLQQRRLGLYKLCIGLQEEENLLLERSFILGIGLI